VQFSITQTVPNTNRDLGIVTLADGRSLLEVLVSEGQVKLRDDAQKIENDVLVDKLRKYEDQARSAGMGVWNTTDDGHIDARYELPSSPQDFLEEHKGKQIAGESMFDPNVG